MTKVLFLLSAVVMAIAAFFSYQNQQAFKQLRLDRQANVKKINSELSGLQGAVKAVEDVKASIGTVSSELTQEQGRVDLAKIKLKNTTGEIDRATSDLASTTEEIKKIKDQVESLPPGVTIENITEGINKLKTTIAENEDKAKKGEESATAKQKELEKVKGELNSIQRQIEERKKLFDRNSMTATIVAVNNDWGFVVIDGGQNKGITTDTKLLVTRGTQTIGKLNIVSVDGNKTVANIEVKSLRSGLAVAPGDKVILESLYQ